MTSPDSLKGLAERLRMENKMDTVVNELRVLLAKATRGPWWPDMQGRDGNTDRLGTHIYAPNSAWADGSIQNVGEIYNSENRVLACAAVNALPALLERLAAAEKVIRAGLGTHGETCPYPETCEFIRSAKAALDVGEQP